MIGADAIKSANDTSTDYSTDANAQTGPNPDLQRQCISASSFWMYAKTLHLRGLIHLLSQPFI